MRQSVGLWVLFAKLGPKLFLILSKLLKALYPVVKALFGIKAIGVVASVGLYAYLFTWQMGIAIVVFLAVHEYGHLVAMKQCGLKVKGMYMIPGFGAVALGEGDYGSAENAAYIAIMGPVFGIAFFSLPFAILYWCTGYPLWAAIAAFTGFINLVNLLPILPLDGGHILRALAYTKSLWASFIFITFISLTTGAFAVYSGFGLLTYMTAIGMIENMGRFGLLGYFDKLLTSVGRIGLAVVTYFGIKGVNIIVLFLTIPTSEWTFGNWIVLIIVPIVIVFTIFYLINDIYRSTIKQGRPLWHYPFVVVMEFGLGLVRLRDIKKDSITPIDGYTPMKSGSRVKHAAIFLVMVGMHVALIYSLSSVPGSEFIRDLLD